MSKDVVIRFRFDSNSKEIVVTEKDVKKLGKSLSNAADQAKPLDAAFSKAAKWGVGILGLTSLVGGLSSGFRRAVAATEDWKRIEGKINLVSGSTQELRKNQESLFTISQKTFQVFDNSAGLFQRISSATKDMDIAQQSLLDITTIVNKGLVVSSASTAEQSSTITQFSQALAGGVLRGEEFNSIMENGNRLAVAMADGLGVTIGELRNMAMEGKLTADVVIEALLSQKAAIDDDFAKMPIRIEQAYTQLDNSITKSIGQLDGALGISAGFSEIIQDLSSAIDDVDTSDVQSLISYAESISHIGLAVAGTAGTYTLLNTAQKLYVASIPFTQLAFAALTTSINGTNAAVVMLNRSIMANPVGMLVGLIAGVVAASEGVKKMLESDGAKLMLEAAAEQQAAIKAVADEADTLHYAALGIRDMQDELNRLLIVQEAYKNARVPTPELDARIAKAQADVNAAMDQYGQLLDSTLPKQAAFVRDMDIERKALAEAAAWMQNLYDIELDLYGNPYDKKLNEVNKNLIEMADAGATATDIMTYFHREMNDVPSPNIAEAYRNSIDEAKQEIEDFSQFVEDALSAGFSMEDIFDTDNSAFEKLHDDFSELSDLSQDWTSGLKGNAKAIANIGNAFADISKEQKSYQALVDKNIATDEEKDQHLQNQIAGYANLAGAMSGAFAEGSNEAKAFSAVQSGLALVNAVTAVTGAWASAPFPANLPAVAATSSAVIALLSNIGQSFGSGGGGGGGPSVNQVAFDNAKADVEAITDRLDTQIGLLKSISLGGSASYGEMASARLTAESLIPAAIGVISGNVREDVFNTMHGSRKYLEGSAQKFYDEFAIEFGLQAPTAVSKMDPEKFATDIATFFESATVEQIRWYTDNMLNTLYMREEEVFPALKNIEGYIGDFADATIATYTDLKDSIGDWRDSYDEISGTDFFYLQDLEAARDKVGVLMQDIGATTYDSLFKTLGNIGVDISGLESAIVGQNGIIDYDLLYIETQNVNSALQAAGISANYSAEDLLNMVDSLKLVGTAALESEANIASWQDGFLTDAERAINMAADLGVPLADSLTTLSDLFNQLAYDADGLTNADLALLDANKDLIASRETERVQVYSLYDIVNGTNKAKEIEYDLALAHLGLTRKDVDTKVELSKALEMQTLSGYEAAKEAYELAHALEYQQVATLRASAAAYDAMTGPMEGIGDLMAYSLNITANAIEASLSKGAPTAPNSQNLGYWQTIVNNWEAVTGGAFATIPPVINTVVDSLETAATSIDKFNATSLTTAANTFSSIYDMATGFVNSQYSNDKAFLEANLRSSLAQAAGIDQIINSGQEYTQSDLNMFQDLVGSATSSGANLISSMRDGFEKRFAQRAISLQIQDFGKTAQTNEKTITDMVNSIEKLEAMLEGKIDENISLTAQIAAANNRLVSLNQNRKA
jgi:tape measure domain-containing protein